MILAAILLFTVVLIWDVITDYHTWLSGKTIDHKGGAEWRTVLLIPSALCFLWSGHWWIIPIVALMLFSVWWLIFDTILNTLMGQSPFHVGTTAVMDRAQASWPVWFRAAFKISLAGISIFAYIKFR